MIETPPGRDDSKPSNLWNHSSLGDSIEPSFNHVGRLARRLLNVPTAQVAIIPIDRDLLPLTAGFVFHGVGDDHPDTVFAQSLSRTVIESAQPLVIHDSREKLPSYVEEATAGHNVVAFLGVPLKGADGNILGSIFVIDRIPRIWTEENVQDIDDLGVMVAREIVRLQGEKVLLRARAEVLQEIDRRKDEFLSILGHELRGPLAAILSAIQLMRQAGMDEEEMTWAHGVIERQCTRLVRLIDDLLDVSRLTLGKIQLKKQSIALAEVVDRAVTAVRVLSERKNQEMDVTLEEESMMLHADPTRVEQILVSLLNNAVKYTEEKGRIAIRAGRSGDGVAITVSDTGAGISAELLPHVFDFFFRTSDIPAHFRGGLGTGLTLVRLLTEMHGGRAEAASDGPGKGSRFSVCLPLREGAPTTVEAGKPVEGGGPRRRILVVDDNIDSATSMAMLLKVSGHDVRLAYDGNAAVELALDQCPDAVLLDIGLPGRDGYAVAEALRRDERCRGIFIVALSGYGRDEDRRRSREAGFNAHLVKPVDVDKLLKLLAEPQSADFATGTS
jgi:signal transduction histidine kinase/ActR/RegA family two-component response regulator